jgi:hypothetical protein
MKGEPTYVISGQVMYMGPPVAFLGLGYSKTWRNGIDGNLYPWITKCPALGGLFIPVADIGKVLRELNFDYAHNMRGTTGVHVTLYRAVQKWLAELKQNKPPSGLTIEKHHA